MRLGDYPCIVEKKTLAFQAYKKQKIIERHRHRYEVNPKYTEKLKRQGLIFSGKSPDKKLMEIAELSVLDHPFMLGTQFHPEFTSSPLIPNPLFLKFISVALKRNKK
jgi:CTP synthase